MVEGGEVPVFCTNFRKAGGKEPFIETKTRQCALKAVRCALVEVLGTDRRIRYPKISHYLGLD